MYLCLCIKKNYTEKQTTVPKDVADNICDLIFENCACTPFLDFKKYQFDPNCSTQCLLSSWYGQGCCGHLSGPLCMQLGRLCLLASLTHPPTHPPSDIAGCVQNISQNQPVHPVAI